MVGLYADAESGRCMSCDALCMDCSETPSRCIRCWEPNFLTRDGRCETKCTDGFYGNLERSVCEPCSRSCATCADGFGPDLCLTCPGPMRLYRNTCMSQCPSNTYVLERQGSARTCFDSCPMRYYVEKNKCVPCKSSCVDCFGSGDNCTSCKRNEYLQPTAEDSMTFQCWKSCDEGYVTDASGTCRKCSDANCLQCHLGRDFCKTCKNTHKLQMGICVKSCARGLFQNGDSCTYGCAEGHYGNKRTRQCESCLGNCKTCSNATHCTTCYGGFYTKSGSCVRDCGSDHISLGFLSSSDVRLVGGETPLEGRVEIQYAGKKNLRLHSLGTVGREDVSFRTDG